MTDKQLTLPKFDGRAPDDSTLYLTGSERFSAELGISAHVGDVVHCIVEAKVGKVTHSENAGGDLSRVHTLAISKVAIVDAEEGGGLLHDAQRAMYSAAGIDELPLDEPADDNVTPIA